VPVIWIAQTTDALLAWPQQVPISHYTAKGLGNILSSTPPKYLAHHRLRFFSAWFNPLVTALLILVFGWLAYCLFQQPLTQVSVVFSFGFASLIWPYSGTFFSEPLATLLSLVSFAILLNPSTTHPLYRFLSGLCLGFAVATHLSAMLMVPFWAALYFWPDQADTESHNRTTINSIFNFGGGLLLPILALGLYNFWRFGSFLETGRSVDAFAAHAFGYGRFQDPWLGLEGLLISTGKGLWFFVPLSLVSLLCWPTFHRLRPRLSWILLAMIATRLFFIASRSDWHGGFSLGPRYLVMVLPYLILPIGFWLTQAIQQKWHRRIGLLAIAILLAAIQQAYFAAGEIFTYFHILRITLPKRNIDILSGENIYRNALYSPIWRLHEGMAGPFWASGQTPLLIWAILGFIVLTIGLSFGIWSWRKSFGSK
jgi:hypothetical protein